MNKDFWKFMMHTDISWFWYAEAGLLGEEGEAAAEEYEQEMGPLAGIILVIFLFVLLSAICVYAVSVT